uniref:Uncharacterized protein n=1 Tax=Oryza meridionalis TaxID=40149 RepID=A0A0E0F1G2_9ORYZ
MGSIESKKTRRRRRVGAAAAAAATDICGIAAGRREGSGGAWLMISGRRRHTPAGAEEDPEAERRNTLAKADRIIAITSLLLLNPLPWLRCGDAAEYCIIITGIGFCRSLSDSAEWSMNQARSFRWNLTASAARPNPQGSFHYGTIATSRTRRYAVNGVSFVVPDTPLKLVDNYNITNVIGWDSVPARPDGPAARLGTPVVRLNLHEFIEVVFQNTENELQSCISMDMTSGLLGEI